MRRGCISLGEIKCDGCGRIVRSAERYLATTEESGAEVEKGKTTLTQDPEATGRRIPPDSCKNSHPPDHDTTRRSSTGRRRNR